MNSERLYTSSAEFDRTETLSLAVVIDQSREGEQATALLSLYSESDPDKEDAASRLSSYSVSRSTANATPMKEDAPSAVFIQCV